MKKKLLLMVIAGVLLGITACSGSKDDNKKKEEQSVQQATKKENKKNNTALKPVQSKYTAKCDKAGTVTAVTYETVDYTNGEKLTKTAYVYLPYEYDENKQYSVIYCLHGGEGDVHAYLNDKQTTPVKNLLDNMIANGDIEPIIAVAPSYYRHRGDNSNSVADIENFQKEMLDDLIPAVEGKYSTYAETTDRAGIKASRDHRAYTGFSMGSLSTWVTFLQSNEYFHYFMPMSGDCWVNGTQNAAGAAKLLEDTYKESGYGKDDVFIFAVTGSEDIAYNAMNAQINAMKKSSPSFQFVSEENPDGNITFRVQPFATHSYVYLPLYFYNALPIFFGK